jgi:cytochrome c
MFLFLACILFSCKNQETKAVEIVTNNLAPIEVGREIFEGKGNCIACHLADKKVIGPSIQDIAKIYKSQNASIIDFLKNDAQPIVDPSQYEIMKSNFVITKAMSEEELKAIEAYIYSHLK